MRPNQVGGRHIRIALLMLNLQLILLEHHRSMTTQQRQISQPTSVQSHPYQF